MKHLSLDAYKLMHEGALALADVEATGIRLDIPYLKEADKALEGKIIAHERRLWRTDEMREWKREFKEKTKLDSPTQLATVLFKRLGYKPMKATRKGNAAVDDEALRRIGTPFSMSLLERRKLLKVKDTYIAQFLRLHVDGVLHPSFNLHLVQTFRSSSDGPNFQNIPVRDPEQGATIRTGIVPHRPQDRLAEIDFSGIEVRVAACYHKDPTMLAYIRDPSRDMHRDMAAECFLLEPGQVTDDVRYAGKGGFVFPAFYGSYYELIGPAMWRMIREMHLATKDGTPLYEHLEKQGVDNVDDFTGHIEAVEKRFWGERFPVYAAWRRAWYEAYLKRGSFDLLSGFCCQGPMRRNEVINYPVQGAAFHCLLWCLIQLHRWLTANEMESAIIGQIHDSIVLNLAAGEGEAVLRKARSIMTRDLPAHWKWLIVPMDVDVKIAEPGESWNNIRKVKAA